MDALRQCFTGEILNIPCSDVGQYENTDAMKRNFRPLKPNEAFFVDEDFLDRANIRVVKDKIMAINKKEKWIKLSGEPKPVKFDKILVAWGAEKRKFDKKYENVYYLKDRFSHAKVHNELLKAKRIMIYGFTLDAFQTAASAREYLDSLGYTDTQIVVMCQGKAESQSNFGPAVHKAIVKKMREMRISVLTDVHITKM